MKQQAALILLLTILTACTTTKESEPARTATEQMLISTAAERAAEKLAFAIPKHSRVYVDAGNFEGTDSKYAIGTLRAHLLQQGMRLVDDKNKARVIVEIRSGALSIDTSDFLIGIPSFSIPIPLTAGNLTTPQIAFYDDAEQKGVAKFAAVAYDAKEGNLISAQNPQYGFSHKDKLTVMILATWSETDAVPKEGNDRKTRPVDEVLPGSDTPQ